MDNDSTVSPEPNPYLESINSELKKAVLGRDVEKVKSLLSAGADVNMRFEEPPWKSKKSTCLHIADSAEVARQLLLHGASVNAQNAYGATPLYVAVRKKRDVTLVKELLKQGADVNARILMGDTALNLVVKNYPDNLEIVKELLKYGADTRIRSREVERYPSGRVISKSATAMVHSMKHAECAKLLIKYDLLRNFDVNYRRITFFDFYKRNPFYHEVSHYVDECITEILQMKQARIDHGISLYELTVLTNKKIAWGYVIGNNVTEEKLSTYYPIYHDIISERLDLKRILLLSRLENIQVYTFDKEKKIVMNFDCSSYIAKYLSDSELYNFVVAFE